MAVCYCAAPWHEAASLISANMGSYERRGWPLCRSVLCKPNAFQMAWRDSESERGRGWPFRRQFRHNEFQGQWQISRHSRLGCTASRSLFTISLWNHSYLSCNVFQLCPSYGRTSHSIIVITQTINLPELGLRLSSNDCRSCQCQNLLRSKKCEDGRSCFRVWLHDRTAMKIANHLVKFDTRNLLVDWVSGNLWLLASFVSRCLDQPLGIDAVILVSICAHRAGCRGRCCGGLPN